MDHAFACIHVHRAISIEKRSRWAQHFSASASNYNGGGFSPTRISNSRIYQQRIYKEANRHRTGLPAVRRILGKERRIITDAAYRIADRSEEESTGCRSLRNESRNSAVAETGLESKESIFHFCALHGTACSLWNSTEQIHCPIFTERCFGRTGIESKSGSGNVHLQQADDEQFRFHNSECTVRRRHSLPG